MKDRIKKIRRDLDLTQQEFADRLGVKRGAIANYEIGRNIPADSVVSLICREFAISEEWLRTGSGEMFAPDASDELEDLAKKYDLSHGAMVVIEKFVKMKEKDRQVLLKYCMEVAAALSADDVAPEAPAIPAEMSIDEKVALYRQELEREEKAAERSGA